MVQCVCRMLLHAACTLLYVPSRPPASFTRTPLSTNFARSNAVSFLFAIPATYVLLVARDNRKCVSLVVGWLCDVTNEIGTTTTTTTKHTILYHCSLCSSLPSHTCRACQSM